ncbi:YraN family protein [Marisediminicola senii]|uniref:YraN family protein n=1 Tax=Marisediminicola senii TaxID=2711233 RepID=UPI0013EC3787|nr:YraN family protein [Marisediminicola senii]
MAAKDELGRRGEDIAVAFLVHGGYDILGRNWRCPQGEIDVIARDGADTVFVEVKTRSGTGFGHPLEAITAQKLARLRRLAGAWCDVNPGHGRQIRIDAIAVVATTGTVPVVDHLKRVF